MDINELLNPTNENKMYDEGTEEEIEKDIHQAVVERRNAEQDREKNGGDDNENEVLNTRPSRREALAAASTIWDYVSDIDEPFARTLKWFWQILAGRRVLMHSNPFAPLPSPIFSPLQASRYVL
ncbi:hypothetical protein H0H87_003473 [Tephrocybe sp. NHM501043]|nr:hypothetical protein H0H87_003473 [Tephrocybe sp. NHM501043]